LRIRFDAAPATATVSSFGDWDVTFDVSDGTRRLARVTAVQGSPFAWIESDERSLAVYLPPGATSKSVRCAAPCVAARVVEAGGTSYLVAATGTLAANEGRVEASFPRTGTNTLSVGVLAPGTSYERYLPYALAIPSGTRVSWKETRGSIETTFSYPRTTLIGLFPHHVDTLEDGSPKPFGTYRTLRGPVALIEASSFVTRVPEPDVAPDPPLDASLKRDASFLRTLRAEVASQDPAAGDSYAAGKQLLRSALLALLADGTDDPTLKRAALGKTVAGIGEWCGGKYGYDARLGGIIGEPASFGSEHYNDHHFHYGYVVHAAAIAATLDRSFERRYGDCVDLLVRDIAAPRGDPSFPFVRYMDPYAGHSWANGLTRFADGQNQESVSEAVQAWYAVAAWGDATGQGDLSSRGRWLLAQELQGAKSYWLDTGKTKTLPAGFAYPMVSIVWGGKADYATFFDAADAAVRGIQFFPAISAIDGLADAATVRRLLSPLAGKDDAGQWTNHLRLVARMAGVRTPEPGRPLDPFYSESYVRNWWAAH
jgi:hypothetical protein